MSRPTFTTGNGPGNSTRGAAAAVPELAHELARPWRSAAADALDAKAECCENAIQALYACRELLAGADLVAARDLLARLRAAATDYAAEAAELREAARAN